MSRRIVRSRDQASAGQSSAAEPVVSQNDPDRRTHGDTERQSRKVLAEYFAILQEWSVKGRRDADAADAWTTQP
jgi:hypothetical protein